MDPRNGEVLALGSYPSFDANLFAKPLSQAQVRPAQLAGQRRAAVQPRDRGDLSDRLDVQADHRDGGAGERASSRRARSSPTPASSSSATADFQNARGAVYGPLNVTQALKVSSDVFFYTLGERANPLAGQVHPDVGAQARPRPADGDRHPGRVRRASCPDAEWRNAGYAAYQKCAKRRPRRPSARARRCSRAAASSARGPRATTSTSPSARATCRPRRCSWRSPTRRSSTAATSCGRTSAGRSRTALGRQIEEVTKPPRRKVELLRGRPAGDPARACAARRCEDGGTSADVFKGFPLYRVRQDRHGGARRPARPVLVRRLRAAPDAPDRRRRDDRARRLRRGDRRTRRAPDPLRVVRTSTRHDVPAAASSVRRR